jgi:hypothetical protein
MRFLATHSRYDQRLIEFRKWDDQFWVSITHKGITTTQRFLSVAKAKKHLRGELKRFELAGFSIEVK